MDFLLIFLIILILLSILYLLYRNYQYYRILEKFDNNNTQSSLSTYFQNTVDYDTYATNSNMFNGISAPLPNNLNTSMWNGTWANSSLNIYAIFSQKNDTLIISLSNSSFNNYYSSLNSVTIEEESSILGLECYPNSFIGTGKLSNNLMSFNLTEVICNNYSNTDLNLTPNIITILYILSTSTRWSSTIRARMARSCLYQ